MMKGQGNRVLDYPVPCHPYQKMQETIGPKNWFDQALPLYFGTGMESRATDQKIVFKQGPERYEDGSNNLLGATALSCALMTIERAGMQAIRKHESDLPAYGISLLFCNPNVILYGDTRYLEYHGNSSS